MTINQLIQAQKQAGQDYEFYPTTQEIVNRIAPHISGSVLDIGCGNGAFFDKLNKAPFANKRGDEPYGGQKYGIEKSVILSDELPNDVILIGTDFYQQSLIDKKVDFIWCNPPYSDFEYWAEKIIREGNAKKIGMVIPERWSNSDLIRKALFDRDMEAEVLGDFDFMNAERKARAKVQLLYIHGRKIDNAYGRYSSDVKDAFDVWFDNTFKINAEVRTEEFKDRDEKEKSIDKFLAVAENKAEMLVTLYNRELQEIYDNYKSLESLNPEIFKELKVDIHGMKEALKLRLRNLKSMYWDRLFTCYDEITSRLTSFSVGKVTKRLRDNTAIDFSLENIFQLTLWVIKNSNTMYDEQLKHYYSDLIREENISRYKSNRHWTDDKWRYTMDKLKTCNYWNRREMLKDLKGVKLEYRIIVEGYTNYESWGNGRLSESTYNFIGDTMKIGQCLGFDIDTSVLPSDRWNTGDYDWSNFDIELKNGEVFCNVKLYKNGNRHLKFHKDVIKKLNVEAGRLFGWIRSKEEAQEDLGLTPAEVATMWGANRQIQLEDCRNILRLESNLSA